MIEIPKQLKNLKFCKILKNTKIPYEKDWPNVPLSYEEISAKFPEENYGVLCGYENLAVIDSDNIILQNIIEKNLPKTFKVKTGRGGVHNYYFIPDLKEKIILNLDANTHLGEIQFKGQQVVGPGSIHPNGNKYEVIDNTEIQTISLAMLSDIIKDFTNNTQTTSNIIKRKYKDVSGINVAEIWDISKLSKSGDERHGEHPIHGSTTGENFWVNIKENKWHCFRCNSGGGPLSAIAVKEGIIKCEEAKENLLSGKKGEEILKIAIQKYGLTEKSAEILRTIASESSKLEKEIYNLNEKVLRRQLDVYLQKISELEIWSEMKYLLGLLAKRTFISKKELENRIENLHDQFKESICFSIAELMKLETPEIQFYIDNLIPEKSLIFIQGKPGQFKSMFALYLCMCLISKKELLNTFKVLKSPKILYYDLENEILEIKKRIIFLSKGLNINIDKGLDISKTFKLRSIEKELEKCKNYDIIILDSYRRFLEGDENQSSNTNKFYNDFLKILQDMGKTVIVIMHEKKGDYDNFKYEGGRLEMVRGSGDIGAQPDLVFALTKLSESKKLNTKNTIIDLYLSLEKNRKSIEFDDFAFRAEKEVATQSTHLSFVKYGKPPKPREKLKNTIIEFVNDKKNTTRKEIVEHITNSTDYSENTVFKLLTELVNTKEILQDKRGEYKSLFTSSEENSTLS